MDSPIKASAAPNTLLTRLSPARSSYSSLPRASAVFTAAVVLLAIGLQFFAPHLPHTILRALTPDQSPTITLRNPIVFQEPQTCPKPVPQVEFVGTFNTRPERSMALAEQAKRVAAEFDFTPDAVNKAVQEFIREMGVYDPCEYATHMK